MITQQADGLALNFTEERLIDGFKRYICAIRAREAVLNCSCKHSCTYGNYPKSFSQTPWPRVDNQLGFYDKYIKGTEARKYFQEYEQLWQTYYAILPDANWVADELIKLNTIERNFLQVLQLYHMPKYLVNHISTY